MTKREESRIKNIKRLLDKTRIEILKLLYKEDTCACQIVKQTKKKNNLISHHLKTLLDMGYVNQHKNGKHIVYSLKKNKREGTAKIFKLIS